MKKNPYYTKKNENCLRCGTPLGRKNKYCDTCRPIVRQEYGKEHWAKNYKKPIFIRECPECGTAFEVSGNHRKKYCSRQCSNKHEIRDNKVSRLANNQKRKALLRELEHTLTKEEWIKTLTFFGNSCAYCGNGGDMDMEHVIPLSRGGGFTKENIVPACKSCNNRKRDKTVEEWGIVPTKKFFEYFEMISQ